jgi:hypothetical protein
MSLINCQACGETHDQDRTCARPPLAGRPGSALDDAKLYRSTLVEIRLLSILARDLENRLGITDTKHLDHMDGTPYEEWECPRCKHRWLSTSQIPCSRCYPEGFEALRRTEMQSPNAERSATAGADGAENTNKG